MTKEEAITFLKCDRERTCYDFKIGHCDGCNTRTALDMAIKALKAVDIVRCKDCIYSCPFDEEELKDQLRVGEWHCEFWYAEMHEDDYCSCGKRR